MENKQNFIKKKEYPSSDEVKKPYEIKQKKKRKKY
jgi:hypothetical protein